MVHLYDLAQLRWISLPTGSQGYCFSLISCLGFSRGPIHSLGHHNIFCLPCCIFVLQISNLRIASSLFYCSSLWATSKRHAVRPLFHISSCVRGSLFCMVNLATLPQRPDRFSLLLASVTERKEISFADGALLQHMTT
jgi:hypothetical protein